MSGSSSLAARAFLAVLLMVGFYLLALTIAAALLWIPWAELHLVHRIHIKLLIVCVVGAGIILWSILPRTDRFDAPGPRLEAERHPLLFDELERIARATGQAMPVEVFLVPDVNAWVAGRGGVMGFGSRRVMGLGLPLLRMLSVSEMRAVLAHEFGHYHAGDTRLGPWVHTTRSTIGRTLRGLEHHSGLLQKPFEWYGSMFLRITHAVSRAQEFAADALAARVAGPVALQSGLRRIHAAAQVFGAYWQVEVIPVLQAGFRPPLAEGFARFSACPAVAEAMNASVEEALREGKTDPFDTHPAMAERIAAVAGIDGESMPPDHRPAMTLLGDVQRLEEELVDSLGFDPETRPRFEPLDWEEIGRRVVQPAWEDAVRRNLGILSALTVEQVPDTLRGIGAFAARLADLDPALPARDRAAVARWVLGVALGLVLARSGHTIRSLPGQAVTLCGPLGEVAPMELIASLAAAETSDEEWSQWIGRLGIAGRRLAEPPA